MTRRRPILHATGLAAFALAACSGGATRESAADGDGYRLPWPATALPPVTAPNDNRYAEPKRLLGRILFYDPLLSADRATACVTCHSEIWGLGDQLPRSVGIEGQGVVGPGRTGSHRSRRNAPALWNLGLRSALFWDGRASSLEEQVFFPLRDADELAREPDAVIAALRDNAEYTLLFQNAFPEAEPPVSSTTFAQALATFVRAYVSDRAPYDQFLAGDTLALDAQDRRGVALFAQLECDGCHVPPRFDSDCYANRAVPDPEGLDDGGRFEVTGDASERAAFRVPTLRNARETGPYFHNGAEPDFGAAIAHEVEQQVELGVHEPLSGSELTDLTQFLRRALTDTSREQHPISQVPSGLRVPVDDERLLRGQVER